MLSYLPTWKASGLPLRAMSTGTGDTFHWRYFRRDLAAVSGMSVAYETAWKA